MRHRTHKGWIAAVGLAAALFATRSATAQSFNLDDIGPDFSGVGTAFAGIVGVSSAVVTTGMLIGQAVRGRQLFSLGWAAAEMAVGLVDVTFGIGLATALSDSGWRVAGIAAAGLGAWLVAHSIFSLFFHGPKVERQRVERPRYPTGTGCEAFADPGQRKRCESLRRANAASDHSARAEPAPRSGRSLRLVPLLGPTSGVALLARF